MTFEEWEGRAFDRFSGTIGDPRFSGNFVKHLLADWKAEREKLIGALDKIVKYYDQMPKSHGYFYAEDIARAVLAEAKEGVCATSKKSVDTVGR